MASLNVARLGVVLGLNTAEFTAQLDKALSDTKKFGASVEREAKNAARDMQALIHATEDYGKEVSHLTRIQRELNDVTGRYYHLNKSQDSQHKDMVAGMLKEAAAMDAKIAATKKLNAVNLEGMKQGMNAQQKAALGYQTTDIITGLAGGQNPLLVMIQQGGQLRDQFGGFKPLFAGIAQAVTLSGVAFTGLGATLGILGYAAYKGSAEFAKLRDDLILTNNYAGMTQSSFVKLSEALGSNLKLSVGDAKSIFDVLSSSGKIAQANMESVAYAIGSVAKLSSDSAEAVAQKLLPSFDGTTASAKRLNSEYHFLTLEQYKYIEQLNQQGKLQDAINFTAGALTASLANQKRELGLLESAWSSTTKAASEFWHTMLEIGKPATLQDVVDNSRKAMLSASEALTGNLSPIARANAQKLFDQSVEAYKNASAKLAAEKEKTLKDSAQKAADQAKIENWDKAGGARKAADLAAEYEKLKADEIFQAKMFNANEMEKFRLESEKRISDKEADIRKESGNLIGQFSAEQAKNLAQFRVNEELKVSQQIQDLNRKTLNTYKEQQATTRDALEMEKQKMGVYQDNFFISQADAKIAEDRLKTQQEIARIQRDLAKGKLTGEGAAELIKEQEGIQKTREEVDVLATKLQYVKDINSAVFQSMTQAIQAFLITGKLSFKDFATSVIASIMQVQAEWLSAQAVRGLGSWINAGISLASAGVSAGSSAGLEGNAGVGMIAGGRGFGVAAAGGFIDSPTLVGENGPELFVPQGAGTIIPNQQMSNMGNQPSVVYNGPYIANMQAIDTQSGVQFLAKNKMTIWSMNQSANRSIPAGR